MVTSKNSPFQNGQCQNVNFQFGQCQNGKFLKMDDLKMVIFKLVTPTGQSLTVLC